MRRSLFMPLIALLAAACVQVGALPSGSPVVPSGSAATAPPVSTSANTLPGTPDPIRTKRPRPRRSDSPTQPPTAPPTEPPTAPPTEAGLPDLDVASITVYEDAGVVKLVIDVRNTGPGNAGRFLVSAVCAGRAPTEVVDGLASGSDARITFSLDDPPGPDLVPQVAVDPRDELLESNEDNNVSLIDDPLCGIPALQFPPIGWQAHAAG